MPQVTAVNHPANVYDLAGQWLVALGWPNTKSNRQALGAWFISEAGHNRSITNGVNDIGWNPLNISSKSGNYRKVRGHYIQVYATQAEGIAAFKALITSPNHRANNYPGVVAAFNNSPTNGANVVSAIINTGWVTGGNGPSYWHTVKDVRRNLLQDVFYTLSGGQTVVTPPPLGTGAGSSGGGTFGGSGSGSAYGGGTGAGGGGASSSINTPFDPANIDALKSITSLSNFLGKKPTDTFTQADADKINAVIDQSAPWIKNLPFWNLVIPSIANQYVGGTVANAGAGLSNVLATDTGALNKAGGITVDNATKGLGNVAAWFLGHALGVLAVGAGGVLILFGLYLTTKEAIGGSDSAGLVSPVPVFIREHS